MSSMVKTQKMDISTINDLLVKNRNQIAAALPKHFSAERMTRIILTEVRRNPSLLECNSASLLGSIMTSSQLGLEVGPALGHAYLVPYNSKAGKECQLIIGYRGMIDLALRSGKVLSCIPHAVYENDLFEFEYGLNEHLRHIPSRKERGTFVGAYAKAELVGGGKQFVVMFRNEIDQVRKSSKGSDSTYSPWHTHYEEMAKKTVIRRLFKYLPVSIDMQRAVNIDEASEGSGNQYDAYELEGFSLPIEKQQDNHMQGAINQLNGDNNASEHDENGEIKNK